MVERVLDVDAMLAPIEGDSPVGVNLRDDTSGSSPLFTLSDLRRTAAAAERSMVMDEDAGIPEQWGEILDKAPEVLATRSKDLRVACWLIEAAARYHGFAGLRDGFDLVAGLVEQYWDDLYPPIEDSIEDKTDPIAGLNGVGGDGALIAPIRLMPLTEGMSGSFGLWQFEQANELRKLNDPEKVQARVNAGTISYEQFGQAVLETPNTFYAALAATVQQTRDSFARLDAVMTEKCGADAPPSSNISRTLEEVADALGVIMRTWNKGPPPGEETGAEEAADVASGADGAAAAGGGGGGGAAGPIKDREQAFGQMLRIAEFFRRTEPQSVIPQTLEDLVRRGRLPLDKLLEELIPDADARKTFFVRAGVTPPADGDGDGGSW
ncbi:type VI secretion system protein TssA [uncultured Rhodospira sp.]|uniref:type VI secretion system protein TssA n=1 Tax=uncultured Rhodospira sp. TaxID=1936189 RepID=UPI00262FEADE|nr:type VI secretion system protein TssA [uncultured Rhodospira sp.]